MNAIILVLVFAVAGLSTAAHYGFALGMFVFLALCGVVLWFGLFVSYRAGSTPDDEIIAWCIGSALHFVVGALLVWGLMR